MPCSYPDDGSHHTSIETKPERFEQGIRKPLTAHDFAGILQEEHQMQQVVEIERAPAGAAEDALRANHSNGLDQYRGAAQEIPMASAKVWEPGRIVFGEWVPQK